LTAIDPKVLLAMLLHARRMQADGNSFPPYCKIWLLDLFGYRREEVKEETLECKFPDPLAN
jgi:hypothetical protein